MLLFFNSSNLESFISVNFYDATFFFTIKLAIELIPEILLLVFIS